MSYPFVTSPDIPSERLQALRRAFDATMSDPEFLVDARQQKLDVDPVSGDEIQALVRRVYASPPEVVARARAAIKDGMGKTVDRSQEQETSEETRRSRSHEDYTAIQGAGRRDHRA
jgi:hypothetical protein